MKYYIGIDLGTTNSAVSSFDGENVRVWKSKKDQNDVTPSAIYVDKRGKRFYGKEAYLKSAQQPERCATLFKRYMGTGTKMYLGEEVLSPEECSAEILRDLCKNLPEEIRTSDEVGTVITVPAAFNQMQNAATLEAAKLAGLGKVALMQEPVAAIMSVMKSNHGNANFLIYDLGGGTLDVAIAESISGKVNLLAHGGIAMCGGRDFDRLIMNNLVMPWLRSHYNLPDNLSTDDKYKKLYRVVSYMTESAKIELSSDETAQIEGETGICDLSGEEIYLDIELSRDNYNTYILDMVRESINMTRETIEKAGLTPPDIDRIVFIGGPTNYKPLRDIVSTEVGIPGSIEVNPMTAVSEGAAIFAESVNWDSNEHGRKAAREQIESEESLGLGFRYVARSTEPQAKIAIVLKNEVSNYTFEINSVDTGWSSGNMALRNRATVMVPLSKRGENHFHIFVYDNMGRTITLKNKDIKITYTLVTVGAILASHSLGIEVRESTTSEGSTLDYLVREGDTLPTKGRKVFRAATNIKAGSSDSLNFKLWEGEITESVEDNRFVGNMKITGADFDFGMIMVGAEIICDYLVNDSGSVDLEISVPSISESFNSDHNFYVRQDGQVDLDNVAGLLNHDGQKLLEQVKKLASQVKREQYEENLQQVAQTASQALNASQKNNDREDLQHISDNILKAKKELNKIRRENMVVIRRTVYDDLRKWYQEKLQQNATNEEDLQYQKLFGTAEAHIENSGNEFDNLMEQVRFLNYQVLSRDDEFIVWDFHRLTQDSYDFTDRDAFCRLQQSGEVAIENEDIVTLRQIVNELWAIKKNGRDTDMDMQANIVRG